MIRDVEKSDHFTLQAVHNASGLDYQMPDLDDSLFIVKVTDGHHGLAVKLEGTVYLWLDHAHGTPEERWQIFHELVEEAKKQAWAKGLDTLTCVVPPELQKSFDKRLREIGMDLDRPWPKYSFDLTSYVPPENCATLSAKSGTMEKQPCASSIRQSLTSKPENSYPTQARVSSKRSRSSSTAARRAKRKI